MREIEQENWDDWEREDQYDAEPKCLFCAETFELPEDAFQHCQQVHGFDFLAVKRSLGKIFFFFIIVLHSQYLTCQEPTTRSRLLQVYSHDQLHSQTGKQ